ncbi:MAG: hypothetical protein KIS78_16750 [Labilithrix sp.]|nr:hypothetical protein [Labilithrix sp.]MCW5834051.1 hypothetical protein [Labilithrix sp.]
MKARSLSVGLLVLGLLGGPLYACSDDHDHEHEGEDEHGHEESIPPSCEAFHEDCVRVMQSNAKAKECDDFAHGEGRTEEECAAKKDECVAACTQ